MSTPTISAWLDPTTAPTTSTTRRHGRSHARAPRGLNANAPWLHPERRTIQRDLGGLARRRRVAAGKAQFVARERRRLVRAAASLRALRHAGTTALIASCASSSTRASRFVTDCGMQAVALVAESLIQHGTHAVVMRQVYNKTRSFLEASAKRVGATMTLVDDGDLAALAAALRPETRLVFGETFTNPLVPRAGHSGARRARRAACPVRGS